MAGKNRGSAEGSKQPYQKYETWAKDPFWRRGNYTPEAVKRLDAWLESMRQRELKRFKSVRIDNKVTVVDKRKY